jgi:Flp pilus assembly pilin Flp
MPQVHLRFLPHLRREEGQELVEYALILALVSLVTVGALTAVGQSVDGMLNAVADLLAAIAASL